jgi:hypothetical protein
VCALAPFSTCPLFIRRSKILPVMDRVLSPYLRGGGAAAFNFSALSQDLLAATLEIPFSVPPYMSLIARSVVTLEGIALTGVCDFGVCEYMCVGGCVHASVCVNVLCVCVHNRCLCVMCVCVYCVLCRVCPPLCSWSSSHTAWLCGGETV